MSVFRRIANLFSRSKAGREIDAELISHIEMRIDDNIANGMLPDDARRDAYVRFGNRTVIQERVAGEDAALVVENVWRDIRVACRQLSKSRSFTIPAIVTLALGIGANVATFSVVDAVMLRPLPYDRPEQVIDVVPMNSRFPQDYSHNFSYPDYFDFRAGNHTLAHLVSYHDLSYTMTGEGTPVHVEAEAVAWDLLPALGVKPLMGRGFLPEEEKPGSRVVLISHALWVSEFARDPAIIGRNIHLSGELFSIVGVMPPSFRFPMTAPLNGIWTTLAVDKGPVDSSTTNRGMHFLSAIGRLKPGVSVALAEQDLSTIAAHLTQQYPATNGHIDSAGVRTELSALVGDTRPALLIALGAVALVLLVACGNIANLLLARMQERRREIAMRAALGGGRSRIIRQLLVESLVLSAAGGLAGCCLAFACTPAMLSLIGDSIPRAADAGVDLRILAFVAGISCVAGLLFGIIPAITASRVELMLSLKEGAVTEAAGRDWLRGALIIGQVALGLVLATSAGLLITSFLHLRRTDEGFNPDHLLTFSFETPDARYKDARPEFYREYFSRLRALPGVRSAAGVMVMPMTADNADINFEDPEHPAPEGHRAGADVTVVTPDYFKTMQIPLLQGRDLSDRDNMTSPQVMIVDQAFAQKFFPGENVCGQEDQAGGSQWAGRGAAVARDCGRGRQRAALCDAARDAPGNVSAIRAAKPMVLPAHCAAHRGGTAQPGDDCAATGCVHGQGDPGHQRPHHAGTDVHGACWAAICHGIAGRVCCAIRYAHRCRPVRCDDVLRLAAHAGDWDSHGARSATQPGAEQSLARGGGNACHRDSDRSARLFALGFAVHKHAVRNRRA